MKEANNTPGDNTEEMGTKEHGGDVSPERGSTTKCLTGNQRFYRYAKSSYKAINALTSSLLNTEPVSDYQVDHRIGTALIPNLTNESYMQLQ